MSTEPHSLGMVPLSDEEESAAFAPGQPAKHPFAVLYQGEHETLWDGTAVAVRLNARALEAAGLPVLLRSFSNTVVTESGIPEPVHAAGLPEAVRKEIGHLRDTSAAVMLPCIRHLVVYDAERLKRMIVPAGVMHHDASVLLELREALYRATILYSVWERDRIDSAIAAQLARVAENWVPCEQNRQLLIASGVPPERVVVIPHAYDPDSPLCRMTERRPVMEKRFYAIGRWEPRKGQHELLGAFLLAFAPGEARLVVKHTGHAWDGYPSPEQSVEHWLAQKSVQSRGWTRELFARHVTMIGERIPQSQILKLHFENNIYVSASHGEAWNLPAFDAKIAGNRLVHVPWGGTEEFAGFADVAVSFKLADVHPSYGWEPGAQWAGFSVAALSHALRSATPPQKHIRPADFEQRFSLLSVGALMRERIFALLGSESPAGKYFMEQAK